MVDIGSHLRHEEVNGEWIGLLKTTPRGAEQIRSALDTLRAKPGFAGMRFNDLFLELLARGETIRVLYITGHWLDVDNLEDLSAANAFAGYTPS